MSKRRNAPPLSKGITNQSLSEPDLPSISTNLRMAAATENKATARKHLAIFDSPRSETNQSLSTLFNEFRIELMTMLTTWKGQQEESFASWRAEQTSAMSALMNDVAELKRQVHQNLKTTTDIEVGMEYINRSYEDMKNKISLLERERAANTERVISLEKQLHDVQTQSRSATIEIRNVPLKSERETPTDLVSIIKAVGTAVNVELEPTDLRDVYRMPNKYGSSTTNTPIVAEFTSVSTRYEFLSSVRRFNKTKNVQDKLNTETIKIAGNKTPIYVDERVSPALRKLLFEARKAAKENGWNCWHSNGRIFLRKSQNDKPIRITSEQNLSEVLKNI